MEPKDFAMREAEQMDYAYRLPLYSTMELFIETLTGTCFELRVSPYETVISVKAKIQRLEGIPISQQYLIWQNIELEDEYCLHDYNITDGCTLKLVLAMRGGPINTRRIAMEDPSFSEMADYLDSREELLEKLSPPPSGGNGSKQVTLLVYRDGDQLNFFRVVDRGDGTLTPFSESLSDSGCNLRDDDDYEEGSETNSDGQTRKSAKQPPLSVAQMMENNITAAKMKQLRSQMQNLNLNNSANIKRKPQPSLLEKLEQKPAPEKNQEINKRTTQPADYETKTASKHFDLNTLASPPLIEKNGNEKAKTSQNLTPLRVGVKRAQLKRMKNVDITAEPKVSSSNYEVLSPIESSKSKVVENETESLSFNNETAIKNESETKEEESGRFSPRTRRLLNALESTSSNRRKTYATQTTAYKSPRSTMLQGMIYNRHDMYLRSYGLIASPDEAVDERVASAASGEAPSPEKMSEPSKVLETSHGVKYRALPSKPQFGPGSRLLKSPPEWVKKEPTFCSNQIGGSSSHQTPQPPYAGDVPRNLDRTLRPPFTSGRQSVSGKSSFQKSYFDSLIERNFNKVDTEKVPPSGSTTFNKLLDIPHLPQPPSAASTAVATPSWQKQRLRRLNHTKPVPEKSSGTISPVLNNQSNLRRSFAQNSSKSGLRMKESPHGKVESMSREEAREVVDFINKAVDASILRTLVRSPIKDGKRGNSGQNSRRMSSSALQTPRSGTRPNKLVSGQPTLPPVKPPSKKKRCFHCAKRTGLASSYICRCGNNFCATHRYAESHNCTYDYKTTGRKLLEEANPLVSAPKLPKI